MRLSNAETMRALWTNAESTTNYIQAKSNSISANNKLKILLVLSDVFIIAVMRHQIEPRSQSLPSFKEGVGNKSLTPSISHRLLVPITAIIKSERAQYFCLPINLCCV